MEFDGFDLGSEVQRAVERALRELRTVNVLIAGRTGVGKSTLVNAMFAGNLAETGQGRPVTTSTREYWKEGIPLRIFDTRGLETAAYAETLGELRKFIAERALDTNADRHVHVAWVCVAEDSRRVERAEVETHEILARYVPVLGVVTKARADQGFRAVVQDLLPLARNVVRVRAVREELDDGHVVEQFGLETLVEATLQIVPESHRRAFVAAQRASLEHKRRHAHGIVATSSITAAGFAATPLPFADAAALVPIQIGMLAGISATWGLPISTAFLTTLLAAASGATAATFVGRAVVGGLLKLIPGAGSVLGGAISAATASTITAALGETYIVTLSTLFSAKDGQIPTPDEVKQEFQRRLAERFRRPDSSPNA